MRSDERVAEILNLLAGPTQEFRAAIATTADEVRNLLESGKPGANGNAERAAAELGEFAARHIDAEQFVRLFSDDTRLDKQSIETIQLGLETLEELSGREQRLISFEVPQDGDLVETVRRALADVGRAFGAARTVEMSRTGRYRVNEYARSLGSFPYARWSRTERRIAPPIVVELHGSDMRVAGLAEFLDGSQKIVLVVRDQCPPAPLVRLVTPRTFVLQTGEPKDLERLIKWDGPGIAAVVGDSAAHFVHDPAAGNTVWQRITIVKDAEEPKKAVGSLSVSQQAEELEQLRALAAKPPVVAAAPPEAATAEPQAPSDPVDKLAAWLLSQADLSGLD